MNVRCSFCRNSFNLGRDYIGQAVAEAKEKRQKYHGVECPKCRKIIKVPLSQMMRFAPRPSEEEASETESES